LVVVIIIIIIITVVVVVVVVVVVRLRRVSLSRAMFVINLFQAMASLKQAHESVEAAAAEVNTINKETDQLGMQADEAWARLQQHIITTQQSGGGKGQHKEEEEEDGGIEVHTCLVGCVILLPLPKDFLPHTANIPSLLCMVVVVVTGRVYMVSDSRGGIDGHPPG